MKQGKIADPGVRIDGEIHVASIPEQAEGEPLEHRNGQAYVIDGLEIVEAGPAKAVEPPVEVDRMAWLSRKLPGDNGMLVRTA